jgi:predicted transcriptional regulator
MLYDPIMAARAVQISLDHALLKRIDQDPEARSLGRSAFLRQAVEHYFATKQRAGIDQALLRGYKGDAAQAADEIDGLIESQAWPDE